MTANSTSESTAVAALAQPQYSLQPRSFDEAWNLATMISSTDMAPKEYQGKPERCMVAIQWGDEVGLKPLQSVQNIAVINGRPSLWGDSMLAIVRASPLCEYFIEKWEGTGNSLKAVCRTKRRGEPEEQIREFSMLDAETAKLLTKDTYKQYGKRMLQMRARGWLIRDVYTDLIRGLHMAEEAMDMPPPEKFMGPADVVPAPAAPTSYPQADFDKNLPAWTDVITKGRKTADALITMVESKGSPMTDAQKQQLQAIKPAQDATVKTGSTTAAAKPADSQGPVITFASIADSIAKATTAGQLDDADDLIGSIGDPGQRSELTAKSRARRAEITPAT